ncbi:MAG: hypothetical protein U0800_26125 [Isosphaeraceae bacterium]
MDQHSAGRLGAWLRGRWDALEAHQRGYGWEVVETAWAFAAISRAHRLAVRVAERPRGHVESTIEPTTDYTLLTIRRGPEGSSGDVWEIIRQWVRPVCRDGPDFG